MAAPLIVIFFVCAILVGSAIIFGDDVVTDDYYKEGRLVNNRFTVEKNARDRGIVATFSYDEQQARYELLFAKPLKPDTIIRLQLSHPLQAELDQNFDLQGASTTHYFFETDSPLNERWYLRVEGFVSDTTSEANAVEWRISGEINFSSEDSVILQ